MKTLDLDEVRLAIENRNDALAEFEKTVDELIAQIAKHSTEFEIEDYGFKLRYWPSGEYRCSFFSEVADDVVTITDQSKPTEHLLAFAEILEGGLLGSIIEHCLEETKVFRSATTVLRDGQSKIPEK